MKIIVSTSNNYLHLIPVFTYLFNKYWGEVPVTVVGYDAPVPMPANFTFHSMGKQGEVNEWSTDLRRYFERVHDTHICWVMEDCFIKRADTEGINMLYFLVTGHRDVGRMDLVGDVQKRKHDVEHNYAWAHQDTNYRFSTQPSIWNKKFLLQYLTPGMTPWEAEKQECKNDGWRIGGCMEPLLRVNEGVRKHNPHELDLNGFSQEDIEHIKTLL